MYAKELATHDWHVPGFSGGNAAEGMRFGINLAWSIPSVDISKAAAKFMTAATAAPRGTGTDSQQAAQALANLAAALPEATGDNAFVEPPEIQSALVGMMYRYRFDLAQAAGKPQAESGAFQDKEGTNNLWMVGLDSTSLQNLIKQGFCTNSNAVAYGNFRGMVTADVGTAAAYAARTGEMQPLVSESALLGLLQRSENALNFDNAKKLDAKAACQQEFVNVFQSSAGAAFGMGGTVLGIANLLTSTSGPIVQSHYDTTGREFDAIQQGDSAFYDTKKMIWVPVAMGLVNQGVVPQPPRDLLYDADGKFMPNEGLQGWVEQQLDARAAHDPQIQSLVNRYGPGNVFDTLVEKASTQIALDQ